MKKLLAGLLLTFLFSNIINAQSATFIALDKNGKLYQVSASASGCSYTALTFCTASMGSNSALSIAVDGTTLYTVDNAGNLYKSTLGAANCSKIGAFTFNTASKTSIYGLTVDKNGLIYAASGGEISTFNPVTSTVTKLTGKLPSGYTVGGDLIFYQGQLYMPTKTNQLVQVNLTNLANSTVYLNFTSDNIFGISSVSVPCSNNQVYALSTPSGSGTTDIIALDMQNKLQGADICQLPFETYDAASIAESGAFTPPNLVTHNQSVCAPATVDLTAAAITAGSTTDIVTLTYWTNALATNSHTTPKAATNGTYYIVGSTTSGCSDTTKVVVIINALPSISVQPSTTVQTVCKNGSVPALSVTASAGSGTFTSYQWYSNTTASTSGGILVSTAATASYTPPSTTVGTLYYYCVVTNSNSCTVTSNVSGAINIVSKPNAGNDKSICVNQTATMAAIGTGNWTQNPATPAVATITTPSANNTTITALNKPGNYFFIWSNGACGDTAVVTVMPVARSLNSLTICQSQLPYTWNSIVFATAKTDSAKLTSSIHCDSTAVLALSVTPTVRSNNNVTICQSQLPYTWNGIVFTSAKTDSIKLTSAGNCDSIAILVLNVAPVIRSNVSLTICTSLLPYTWNGIVFTSGKTDSVKLTSSTNCDSIATLILNVTPILRSSSTLTICPAQLPYRWNNIVFATAKTDSVHLVSSSNCDSVATLILTVSPILRSVTNLSICSSALPYTWNGKLFTAPKTDSVQLINTAGCDSMAVLILNVLAPSKSITNLSVCEKSLPYNWNGKSFASAKTDSVLLISSNNCDSTAVLILSILPPSRSITNLSICETDLPYSWNGKSFASAKTDSALLVSSANCDSTAVLILTVNPVPHITVTATPSGSVTPGTEITLTGTSDAIGASYTWASSPSGFNSHDSAAIVAPRVSTVYTLTVMKDKCSVDSSVTVSIKTDLPCFHPMKAFTPNGDGANEQWKIYENPCIQTAVVSIYNRWGGLVYHNNDYQNDWRGTYKESPLPDATYYYVIMIKLPGNDYISTYTGNVSIIR